MLAYAESVRDAAASGIHHVVNIGIGGSDLGPQMVVPALDAQCAPGRCEFHFVSNVDGHDIAPVLRRLKPARDALHRRQQDLHHAGDDGERARGADLVPRQRRPRGRAPLRRRHQQRRGRGAVRHHHDLRLLGLGRRALLALVAIGLPIAIAIGADNFRALLAGAHAMDRHFAETPLARNLPLLLGLLDVWYRNFHGFAAAASRPTTRALRRLPAYLQQLEMESNGKRVDANGEPVAYATSPVVWGEPGTNGQHAYFQMLHQGTDVIPVEFILVRDRPGARSIRSEAARAMLLANGLAQSPGADAGQERRGGAPRRRRPRRPRSTPTRWRATAPSPATGRARRCCSTR